MLPVLLVFMSVPEALRDKKIKATRLAGIGQFQKKGVARGGSCQTNRNNGLRKIPPEVILRPFERQETSMTQDELKQAVARAAIEYVPSGIIGVGTGSTANYFIDELAHIKGKIDGAVASSVATAERLKKHGIP